MNWLNACKQSQLERAERKEIEKDGTIRLFRINLGGQCIVETISGESWNIRDAFGPEYIEYTDWIPVKTREK